LKAGGFETAIMNTSTNEAASSAAGYATSTDEWYFPVTGGQGANATELPVTSKHSLGVEATIWGSWNEEGFSTDPNAGDTTTVLECVSCHDPHAYGLTYRMLTRRPNGAGVAKHPGNESDPWEQRVFVTDQLTFAEYNPLSDILAYTTSDYSNTEIGNKTWNAVDSEWDVEKIHGSTYVSPTVLNSGNGSVVSVWSGSSELAMYSQQLTEWCSSCHDRYHAQKVGYSTPGTSGSGDAIFDYRHKTGDDTPVWDEVDGRYETSSCGYACHNSAQLGCVSCHVAHGTTSDMTPYVTAMPWPGETDAGHFDTLDNGTALGEGWLLEDPNLNAGNETDHDGDARSNLLRIDNRGVCQNPACHPKGKTSYLEPYDDH
jgi:cytochrome c553